MADHNGNGKSAVQHLTMLFGVVAGGLGIGVIIVGLAFYGGSMHAKVEGHGKDIEALEFRVTVLERKTGVAK